MSLNQTAGASLIPDVTPVRPNPLVGTCKFICDIHGFTNHVMGSANGTVFCIECNAALARMVYRMTDVSPGAII